MRWFRRSSETTEHEFSQERLSAYLDEELPPGERGRVERHMGDCPQCRCDLDNLRRTAQWTMALPVVPCPRSFAVPVPAPAKRARVAQRAWGMPALQGATALVAVLFLLAVVGEALLPGKHPALAPAPSGADRESVAVAEATQVVELEAEQVQLMAAEAPAEATAASEEPAVEATVVVSESVEDQEAAAASAAPPGMGVGGETTAAQPPAALATDAAPKALVGATGGSELPTATPWPTSTVAPSLTPVPTITQTATAAPAPTATLVPTLALAPTLVAAANQEQEPASLAQSVQTSEQDQRPDSGWLTVAEIALGIAFVMLGALTVVLMVLRLKRS